MFIISVLGGAFPARGGYLFFILYSFAGGETMLTAFAQGLLRKHLPPLRSNI